MIWFVEPFLSSLKRRQREKKKGNGCKKHPWLNINIKSHVEGFISMSRLKFCLTQHRLYIDFSSLFCPFLGWKTWKKHFHSLWEFYFAARNAVSLHCKKKKTKRELEVENGAEKRSREIKKKLFFSSMRYLMGSFTCRVSWNWNDEKFIKKNLRLCILYIL